MTFTLVVAESDILPIDVPIACLQLSDQRAFGYLSASQQTVRTDIVGERGKQERILPELPEHRAELPQVFPQKRVRLRFVMVRAEYLSPGCNRCPYPTYG